VRENDHLTVLTSFGQSGRDLVAYADTLRRRRLRFKSESVGLLAEVQLAVGENPAISAKRQLLSSPASALRRSGGESFQVRRD
jgi:hypothetical protein